MKIRYLIDEDFTNYKKPAFFIGTCICDWKCCHEANISESVCLNKELLKTKIHDISNKELLTRYLNNKITEAIVIGGLEPIKQIDEVIELIREIRDAGCNDEIIIYTGYYSGEILKEIELLGQFKNIIIKFGRYIPSRPNRFDTVLGVTLISDNQYAQKIS